MGNPTYLIILIGMASFAFILQKRCQLILFANKYHLIAYVVTIFMVGLIWDYFSVTQKIWEFPLDGTIGIRIGVLPIEELLFFLVAPYFGLTLYKFFEKKCT